MNAILSNLLTSSKTEGATESEALVAFLTDNQGPALLAWKGEGIQHDVDEIGPGMEDFFNDSYPKEQGIWMWEGKITWGPVWCGCEPCDPDPQYLGIWRRLTDQELTSLANRGDPWWKPDTSNEWFNRLVNS